MNEIAFWAIICVIGSIVGGIGGFAGIGGAPFMVSALKLFLGFCQHRAQGTVLAVMLPPMSLLGVLVMKKRIKPLLKHSAVAFVTYTLFSYSGAVLAYLVNNKELSIAFGSLLILLGLRNTTQIIFEMRKNSKKTDETKEDENKPISQEEPEIEDKQELENKTSEPEDDKKSDDKVESEETLEAQKNSENKSEKEIDETKEEGSSNSPKLNPNGPTIVKKGIIPYNIVTIAVTGSIVGVFGGMFGIGSGVLMVPLFTEVYGMEKNDARTLSMMVLLPPVGLGAVIEYGRRRDVDWIAAAVLFLLYFVFNALGSYVGKKTPTQPFKLVMGIILMVLGIITVLFEVIGNPFYSEEDC